MTRVTSGLGVLPDAEPGLRLGGPAPQLAQGNCRTLTRSHGGLSHPIWKAPPTINDKGELFTQFSVVTNSSALTSPNQME